MAGEISSSRRDRAAGTKDETGASVDDGIPFACHVCTNNNINN